MAAGWELDPMGRAQYRYFDGTSWTHAIATNGVQSMESVDLTLPPASQQHFAPIPAYPVQYLIMPAYPVAPVTRRLGWAIFALSLLVVLGAVLPWVRFMDISVSGLGGHGFGPKDGVFTLPLGVVAAGLGLARGIAAKRSGLQLTAAIVGLVIGLIVALIGLIDIGSVGNANDLGESVGVGDTVSVGFGLILTLLAGIGLAVVSIVGIVKRA